MSAGKFMMIATAAIMGRTVKWLVELIRRERASFRLSRVGRIIALGAVFGTALAASAVATPVTWTFIETGCTPSPGGCQNLQLPAAEAQLSLPDINSSGTYHFSSGLGVIIETGDKDFIFQWDDRVAPPPNQVCIHVGENCRWDVTFASSPVGLNVTVDYFENLFSDGIDIGSAGGTIGSDAFMPGCGLFATCQIAGFWVLASVPEPSSITALGTAGTLLLLGIWRRRARLQAGPS
jgi:hypothetical protein